MSIDHNETTPNPPVDPHKESVDPLREALEFGIKEMTHDIPPEQVITEWLGWADDGFIAGRVAKALKLAGYHITKAPQKESVDPVRYMETAFQAGFEAGRDYEKDSHDRSNRWYATGENEAWKDYAALLSNTPPTPAALKPLEN